MKRVQTATTIPDELQAIASVVVRMCKDGDPATRTVSDDLKQFDNAYGGLVSENASVFEFSFFPEDPVSDGDNEPKWFLQFDLPELELISTGSVKSIELWRREPDCGVRAFAVPFYCDVCNS